MSESDNKAHNKGGSKTYRDYIISQLDKDFETETFPASDEEIVSKATESYTKDMAKLDEPASGTKGNPEIEHLHTASKHSFSHAIPESATVQGTKTKKMDLQQKVDDTAKGHNESAY
jgi:hypothetical protein